MRRAGVVIALLLVLTSGARAAKPRDEGDANKKVAKEHFQRGQTHYNLGRFDDALAEFSAAYEAAPLPAFLFNIGQCQRQLKNWERALFFFEGYLREIPEAPNRRVVEGLIQEARGERRRVEQEKEAERQRQAEADARAARERQAAEAAQKPAEALPALEPVPGMPGLEPIATTALTPTTPPEDDEPIYTRWWLWTAVGAVVVGGATAVVLIATQPGDNPQISSGPEGTLGTMDTRQ